MEANFQRSLAVTLQYEGLWSDNPADPGGATMKGVTIGTYRRIHPNATKADLRAISDAELASIYRQGFWNPISGDSLASGVDLATFDASVNSGVGRGKQWLAASLGGSNAETVKRICAKRLSFMQGLKIWKNFGKGWAKRVAAIEAKGVAWATAMPGNEAVVKKTLENEASKAASKAKAQKGAGGVIAGGGAGSTQAPVEHFQHTGSLIVFLVIVAAIVGFMIWRSHINKTRAAAYAAEAAAQ
ncbi:secretion activator protein [Mesorhizobium sp. M2D.F.Ca.ET.223.01.1.1]|uniref:glycoside hydrolase family 108 protein n=1 Tax=Mesorhizobium sp. M2D.F.Ca.ET.223.01.1.1 TaxID=2563940 RepID=UPI0010924FBC|nr:glycosyl hydrolase 108 family protein [Mesorhizobium sp. M2D.F.Ca.ET.223.01.1.1]TGR81851.1 secretion activator protein [Mesorhizobium sp. M2D.F.Ca.ET.223.01.1.1]TGT65326.1 secretion activator protein [bacterium M00.F.Ca.ET.159.01.1.1]TGT79437.1 secretion activator protein [bacterium M00.F.Ca.ET.157.01.1.1]